MTQLYVGNLSAEADEKSVRALFSKYGVVREVLMKNGYCFVEFDSTLSADEAMRSLNGSDILGHPMIVEPSHQQRLSRRKYGKVEVTHIPPLLNVQMIETMLSHVGIVLKLEVEEGATVMGDIGVKRVVATYETVEQAHRAAATFKEEPRVVYLEPTVMNGRNTRKGSPGIPASPSKGSSDFPLRILVPSDMVGAIIGKDGATIRMITQITKARVDVHRRENMGSAEKAITIIGPPECCTEACYQIMKIMQNELLMTSGLLENGKYHEPSTLPSVPLKILAHNELVGRVIGKGGNTLKRIMAESGTKITISKLKDLTAYNMERTITILGTIDNCKKAESLISAKLRASYESDMAQFIPVSEQTQYQQQDALSPSPTSLPASPGPMQHGLGPSSMPDLQNGTRIYPQSLPATPTATSVRTFTDFSGEHTRLTQLHGSTGALEVNNLGGFRLGPNGIKPPGSFESMIDGVLKSSGSSSGLSGSGGGAGHGYSSSQEFTPSYGVKNPSPNPPPPPIPDYDDEISDVFSGLSMRDPLTAAPGYGRMRFRRSSAPTSHLPLWGGVAPGDDPQENGDVHGGMGYLGKTYGSSGALPVFSGWNTPAITTTSSPMGPPASAPPYGQGVPLNIWNGGGGGGGGVGLSMPPLPSSRPGSQASSYSGSDPSSSSGFSPIYSPTSTANNGFFGSDGPPPSSSCGLAPALPPAAPLTTAALTMMSADEQRSVFKNLRTLQEEEEDLEMLQVFDSIANLPSMPTAVHTGQW